jgi:peptidyl-Lys metalloendopeptidase
MFSVSLAKASSPSNGSFVVDIHVTANIGSAFLKYNTPFDAELLSCRSFKVFDVTNDFSPVPVEYAGAVAKRSVPTRDHYVSVEAGQTISSTVDLSKCFEFVEGRKYAVQLDAETDTVIGTETASRQLLKSQELHFVAPSTSTAPKLQGKTAQFGGRKLLTVGYDTACTSSQQSTTADAIANALSGVNVAWNTGGTGTLQEGCGGTDYVDMFGAYDYQNFNTIAGNFQRIQDRFASASFNINCGACASSADYGSIYAYVYPSDSTHTIYLCGAYWSVLLFRGCFQKERKITPQNVSVHFDIVLFVNLY